MAARARDYIASSSLYAWYERPIVTALGWGWPGLHIAIAIFLAYYAVVISQAEEIFKKYNPKLEGVHYALIFGYVALALFAIPATLAGTHLADYRQIERANPNLIPKTLPKRPGLPTGSFNWNEPRFNVSGPRAQATWLMGRKASGFLTSLDFLILATPLLIIFVVCFCVSIPGYVFTFAYAREMRRRHLPTEIVHSALSGGRVDGPKLANALSPTLAPVVRDSLADKIERERLTALAERLQRHTAGLDQKLSKETEIARLVIDHARKREELADMENRLRLMGVKRDG